MDTDTTHEMKIGPAGLVSRLPGIDDAFNADIDAHETALSAEVYRHEHEAKKIQADRGLNATGKADRLAALAAESAARLERFAKEDKRIDRYTELAGRVAKCLDSCLEYEPAADLRTMTPRVPKDEQLQAGQREREVRDRLLALPEAERLEVAMRAAGAGDLEALRAIAKAPASFPVLRAAEWDLVKSTFITLHHADLARRHADLQAVAQTMKTNLAVARKLLGVTVDPLAND